MRNKFIFALSAVLIVFGTASCEKYKSDQFDINSGRTPNYITVPVETWQTDTLVYAQGDTINSEASPIITSRVSFPDTLTATLTLDADAPGIPDLTFTRRLAPQRNSWTSGFVIPSDYLPAGVDSTYATLRLVSATGPISGSLKIGYEPGDVASIPLLIYR